MTSDRSRHDGRVVLLVHATSYDRLYHAFGMAVTWAALGHPISVYLFFGALARFLDGTLDEPVFEGPDAERLRAGFERRHPASLYDMLAQARRFGHGVTVGACSGSLDVLGVSMEDALKQVDVVLGLPGILGEARMAAHVLTV